MRKMIYKKNIANLEIFSVLRITSLALSILILAGCATVTSKISSAEDIRPSGLLSLTSQDDELVPGKLVEINDPAFPDKIKVIVKQEYLSALGQTCYQVKLADASFAYEPVAICQRDTGALYVAPRIWTHSAAGQR